jgi:hypothetical protein
VSVSQFVSPLIHRMFVPLHTECLLARVENSKKTIIDIGPTDIKNIKGIPRNTKEIGHFFFLNKIVFKVNC